MTRLNGGELLAKTLAAAGVREVFALHGGHLDAFLVACTDHGIRLTDTRHEASAGHAADAYARATGRLGVCVVTAGPGFTNAYSAITNAFLDRVPVLFVVGSPPLREVELNSLQGGFDQVAAAAPVTRWAHRLTHTERVPDIVEKAIRTATGGVPGPVLLDMPIDVMFTAVPEERATRVGNFVIEARPSPSPGQVRDLLDLLSGAERPVIVPGGGALLARAGALLDELCSITGVPVVVSQKANGILPRDHPCACGGTGALAVANTVLGQPADAVVLLGARMGLFTGGRSTSILPAGATIAQVDVDAAEIGRLRPVALPVVAGVKETLLLAVEAARAGSWDWPDRSAWQQTLRDAGMSHERLWADAPPENARGIMHPYHAARALVAALPDDAVVVCDGGESSIWIGDHLRVSGAGAFLTTGYLGCLGVGPGFAIGAARAFPGRTVVCFSGDGAFAFHLQELDTMVRHGLNVLTVVLNNNCWGMSQHGQDIVFGAERRAIVELGDPDYEKVAVAFGGYGERVSRLAELPGAVRRALASGKPSCLNVSIDADVVNPVTVNMLGDVGANDATVVPYYENIPRD